MAMVTQKLRRNREFAGPSPNSIAIRARAPNARPPEYRILERRKNEDKLQEAEAQTRYVKVCDLKNDWERTTDKRIQSNTVKTRVNQIMRAQQFSVEDRRDRLRELLSREEAEYLQQMGDQEETTLERQAKMRERAKFLKDKREAERLDIVQDKYDQQFRNQCEELRSTNSKRQQDMVALDRLEQLRVKAEMKAYSTAENEMYADLWKDDMMAKAAREERDAKAQHDRNKEVQSVLRTQMAALDEHKKAEMRLKEDEATLLMEQLSIRKMEEQRDLEEKRIKQQEMRQRLDRSLVVKERKQAREEQEQLAFDMKILEQLLAESRNEEAVRVQRKKEVKDEDKRYRDYLRDIVEDEKLKAAEMEKYIAADVEAAWQKRLEQWRLERTARKRLLDEVLKIRQGQIEERLIVNTQKQHESEQERQEIHQLIRQNKQLESQEITQRKQRAIDHESDLCGQMAYEQHVKTLEKHHDEAEYLQSLATEEAYKQKLKQTLDGPDFTPQHPMRKALGLSTAPFALH